MNESSVAATGGSSQSEKTRHQSPSSGVPDHVHPALRTTVLLALMSGLLLAIGEYFGGSGGLVAAFAVAVVMNFVSYWWSDAIILRMYRAQPVGPEHPLYGVVASLAQRAALPMPKVYVIPTDAPNAFATGRSPEHAAVAATEGILRILDRTELEGVLAHELSHVRHRDILISSVAATIAAAIMMLSRFAFFFGGGSSRDDDNRGNVVGALLMMLLAPLAAALIQAAISRSREYAADESGAELVGDPHGLASALRKIEAMAQQRPLLANPATAHLFIIKPFSGRSLTNLFSTHPPTPERIARLLHQPVESLPEER